MYHPSRGGVRGGRDQFNWDDVKGDKHRENYLGHSLKAPVGRWQKGKDLMWYARDAKQTEEEAAASARAEIDRVKLEEEEAMREALGLAPRREKPRVNRLDKREQEELLKRTKAGDDEDKPYAEGERIQGLGFAPVTKSVAPDAKDLLQRQAPAEEERPLAQVISQAHNRVAEKAADQELAAAEDSRQVSDNDIDKKRKRKEEKRAAKEQRREEKKAAKKLRREKRRRHSSTSGSDEELADKKPSRSKHSRRHESDSSDVEERGHRKDTKLEPHRSHSNDDAGPHRKIRASDESDEDMRDRPSGRKSDEKKPPVEERERRVRDTSPRQRHEERERRDRGGRSYNRDEDHSSRRERGRQDDERDRHYSERRHRRSPSPPPRRRPRHDSD